MIAIDTVTSLGGGPVEIDAWGIDAIYTGTQKCLGGPPGLASATRWSAAFAGPSEPKRRRSSWVHASNRDCGERPTAVAVVDLHRIPRARRRCLDP